LVVATFTVGIHSRLSHGSWIARRYYSSNGGWAQQLFEASIAMVMGAIVFARMSQLAVGLTAWFFRRRVVLGRLFRWDLFVLGVPLLTWAYIAYVANFD
jgi:hypothetical protein